MPSTYTLISSNVLSSAAASVTFSAIPATFTDLVVRASIRNSSGGTAATAVTFNGQASGYSVTRLRGNGTTASSGRTTGAAFLYYGLSDSTYTSNVFNSWEMYLPNYLSTTSKPSSVIQATENNSASDFYIDLDAGLSDITSAITSITITANGNTWVSGSSFYLYGISKS
jgi:hypothetical protein